MTAFVFTFVDKGLCITQSDHNQSFAGKAFSQVQVVDGMTFKTLSQYYGLVYFSSC